ncbi:MAG: ribonuclease P protein component [Clostridia bacterium]
MKINAICENRDYRRIYARGNTIVTPSVVIYISKNRRKNVRVGITTSKKIGNAVKRNRARRIIRESIREILPNIKEGYDLVLVARAKTPYLKSTQIKLVLLKQLKSNGILK